MTIGGHGRMGREKKTVAAMIGLFCAGRHGVRNELCADCRELHDYAMERLDRCRFGANKPTCSACTVHCYKPAMRERIREVMRYAGPRMVGAHPLLAAGHLWDGMVHGPRRSRGRSAHPT